jgi:hypothetical protein
VILQFSFVYYNKYKIVVYLINLATSLQIQSIYLLASINHVYMEERASQRRLIGSTPVTCFLRIFYRFSPLYSDHTDDIFMVFTAIKLDRINGWASIEQVENRQSKQLNDTCSIPAQ